MKIQQIRARNVLGCRDIEAFLTTPVSLFCGGNGAGKSSLQETLRLAMLQETMRVTHKKDFGLMVTDGAKEGFVKVVADGSLYEYKLPSGEYIVPDTTYPVDQLQCVLNAQRFADMTPDARREFLTVLTKSRPNKEKITALLKESGASDDRIEATIPMLRAGFPAACDSAKQKATEAKGAWKSVAGGVWGSIKGESWQAPEVLAPPKSEIDAAAELVTAGETALSELQQKLGGLTQQLNASKEQADKLAVARTKVANLDRLRDKLVRDEEALAGYKADVVKLEAKAGTKPKEGLVHDMARFINGLSFEGDLVAESQSLVDAYIEEFGPVESGEFDAEAVAKLPSFMKSRDLMQRSVDNDKRDIAEAVAAETLVNSASDTEEVSDAALAEAKVAVAAADKVLKLAREELKALQQLEKEATERDERTANAKKHHEDVVGWLLIAEQLAPDGIPSQILAGALKPINDLLRAAAVATGWRQVSITPDMSIMADGRLYALHSESERWMIDAMITATVAKLSGLKLLVLDRMDVLEPALRPSLLYWLDDMAADGEIESALVFCTLKAKPTEMPDNIAVFWIQNGELEQVPQAQAA